MTRSLTRTEGEKGGRSPSGRAVVNGAASVSALRASVPSAERDRKGRFRRHLLATPDDTREWLIWSREWRLWHRRSSCGGACGYTSDIAEAGLFPRPKAVAYHDGIKDEAFHVSEKMHLIQAAIAGLEAKWANLRAAQAIEARRAETGTGSVEDESAVVEDHAPEGSQP